MLDSATKKRIDDLRNILVGKIPSPQSQVEQITTGLIYKFMYDMDQEAIELGGVPSFFVGDFEKYSWNNLFDPKLSGVQKVQLYGDAIEHMYTNPTAPQLFREIFKNSFLPFKDPATLNMFLKEINEFHYSHSEKLGDAFEYLLSFMGSQGDAGQFRTPRHIIDFIVDIVNPQKNESVLDPACGTAGFLISSYKHILEKNKDKKIGDRLTASDRKRIGENLVGYDISPDMTRISLVNMYLHQFASPQIHEYDTLSSEDRWNEYYDVILANPPFFSPTGGIQPHSRFGVQSTRAEVLFVDYIMEHLKPTGRAGIIVPEGIIFQTGSAYKNLRKKLVEDSLIGVISLPAGIFQPYSGVKTSILLLDKKRNKESDQIFFAKIENDGFSLGSQRLPISKNDLPEIIHLINANGKSEKLKYIKKTELLNNSTINLSGYIKEESQIFTDYELVTVSNLASIQNGFAFKAQHFNDSEGIPVIRIRDIKTNRSNTLYCGEYSNEFLVHDGDLLIGMDGEFNACLWQGGKALLNQRVCKLIPNDKVLPHYLYWMIQKPLKKIEFDTFAVTVKHISRNQIKDIKIPTPPIEVQTQIVNELEGYEKIITGCQQVIDGYSPKIDIDPNWAQKKLKDLCTIVRGSSPRPRSDNRYYGGHIPRLMVADLTRDGLFVTPQIDTLTELGATMSRPMKKGDVVIAVSGNPGLPCILNIDCCIHDGFAGCRDLSSEIESEYLCYLLLTLKSTMSSQSVGAVFQNLTTEQLKDLDLPVPPKEKQLEIISSLRTEHSLVDGTKKLLEIYKTKIQTKLNTLWGEQ